VSCFRYARFWPLSGITVLVVLSTCLLGGASATTLLGDGSLGALFMMSSLVLTALPTVGTRNLT
jgi:hypothetical protein